MSAGSAFASGVRAGQNIWNSAVNNAMAGKRMDMLKTQFAFEQTQRTLAAANLTKSQTALKKFLVKVSPITNMLDPEQYKIFTDAQLEAIPFVSLDPGVNSTFVNTVGVINKRTGGESANALVAERGLLVSRFRTLYKGQDIPTVQVGDDPPVLDYPKITEMVKIKDEETKQEETLRQVDYDIEAEFAEKLPNEKFPTFIPPAVPGQPIVTTPVKDRAAARKMLREHSARLTQEEAFDVAETKDKIVYRGDFNKWKKLLKNPALDAKNPDDQKLFRTYQHDEEISGLMAEAGLEAFKLADKLIPDPVSGGYENMAQVTGMINDMIRTQEEEAGLKKAAVSKPLTESQASSYLFAGRMKFNENEIQSLINQGYDPGNIAEAVATALLPEVAKTEKQKLYYAAMSNWVAASLRKESGAAIAESEYRDAFKQYFPLIADTTKVQNQKRRRRLQQQRDMFDTAMGTQKPAGEYKVLSEAAPFDNQEAVDAAIEAGQLILGDTYQYYNEQGLIQPGVVELPAP